MSECEAKNCGKGGVQADDERVGGVMDGRVSLFSVRMGLCTFERAHVLLLERRALMDERHPLPVHQWKCLKHLSPWDGPCHTLPSW